MRDAIRRIVVLGSLGGGLAILAGRKRTKNEPQDDEECCDVPEYHEMSDEEFTSLIRSRNAERLGVSEQEVDEMSISEIERQLHIETTEPRHSHESDDSKGGYFVSDSFDVLSREELAERREAVKRYLSNF